MRMMTLAHPIIGSLIMGVSQKITPRKTSIMRITWEMRMRMAFKRRRKRKLYTNSL